MENKTQNTTKILISLISVLGLVVHEHPAGICGR